MDETPAFTDEGAAGESVSGVMGPFDYSVSEFGIKDTSNTDIFCLNGDLVSLWYNVAIPSRSTQRRWRPARPSIWTVAIPKMSAHSKVDWRTGELLYFDYNDTPPYMTYGVANAKGEVVHEVPSICQGHAYLTIWLTQNYTVLHDLPFSDLDVLNHKLRVLTFHRDSDAFGLIPRFGESNTIRWFDCDPATSFISNCWEEGDWVTADGCRSVNPMPKAYGDEGELSHMLAYDAARSEQLSLALQSGHRQGEGTSTIQYRVQQDQPARWRAEESIRLPPIHPDT